MISKIISRNNNSFFFNFDHEWFIKYAMISYDITRNYSKYKISYWYPKIVTNFFF